MAGILEQYIENNHFGKLLGMDFVVEASGTVVYRLKLEKKHLATPHFAHGGVLASLLDACMGVGALSVVYKDGKVVSTLECKVSFLKAVHQGEELKATAQVLKKGSSVLFMEAEVRSGLHLVAKGSGTFKAFPAEKAGYSI